MHNSMTSVVFNEDCMAVMSRYPDKYFDLAIVDPPYGIKAGNVYSETSKIHGNSKAPRSAYKIEWDNEIPSKEYFTELKRVSKHQIIWGANHFIENIPNANSSCWIIWDKENGENDFADCEMAWSSFGTSVRRFKFRWAGMLQGNMKDKEIRIHPTQKPIKLYEWIYKNYLPNGGKVIDTHLGSGSNRIAADKTENIDFVGCELDKEYFDAQEKRYRDYKLQLRMF